MCLRRIRNEQCVKLPSAISTIDGLPVNGSKAISTSVYEKRYKQAIILTSLPNGWALNTIDIQPWAGHTILKDYANLLIRAVSLHHNVFLLQGRYKGSPHMINFDDPGSFANTPKQFEHLRMDRQQ